MDAIDAAAVVGAIGVAVFLAVLFILYLLEMGR